MSPLAIGRTLPPRRASAVKTQEAPLLDWMKSPSIVTSVLALMSHGGAPSQSVTLNSTGVPLGGGKSARAAKRGIYFINTPL